MSESEEIVKLRAQNELLKAELEDEKKNRNLLGKLENELKENRNLLGKFETLIQDKTKLENELKQRDALHTVTKIRYLLERLEEVGRPDNITSDIWIFTMSRVEKWNNMFQSDEQHPWVEQFLKCVRNCCSGRTEAEILTESQKIVKILFNICDSKIHAYYQDVPVNMNVFNSERIRCAIECLTDLESEIIAFNTK